MDFPVQDLTRIRKWERHLTVRILEDPRFVQLEGPSMASTLSSVEGPNRKQIRSEKIEEP
jgi:hypothetical protein